MCLESIYISCLLKILINVSEFCNLATFVFSYMEEIRYAVNSIITGDKE